MNPELPYTPAKLYTAKGDISKPWYAYYFYRNPSDGKMKMFKKAGQMNYIHSKNKRLSFGTMLTQEINSLLREGWSPFGNTKSVLTLKDVLEEMRTLKIINKRARTAQAYKYALDIFYKWLEKTNRNFIYPEQFDNLLCRQYMDYLISEKKFSNRNFNNQKCFMGAIFNMMEEREIIVKNPFRKIKSFPKTHGINMPFSDIIKQTLIDEMILKNYRLYLFSQFIYYCFIRPAELLRLRIGDIDLVNKKITLSSDQTKNKKKGVVVIPDSFVPIVESMHLNDYDKNFFVFGKDGRQSLVPSDIPLSRNSATNHFLEIKRGLKLGAEITLYGFKDTGVCNAYKHGISLYKIMMQCRHSTLSQTQIYLNSLGLEANLEFGKKMK